jgi:hypothetical protein
MTLYKKHIIAILFFKLVLIFLLPITGDEAYFLVWANHMNIGFYDHPPMVGWIIYLMSFISDDISFLRLFPFFSVLLASYLIYKILLEFEIDKQKAKFVSVLFLILPIDILIILFTNDVPLFIFGFIGTYFFVKSLRCDWVKNSLLAGIFLGLSFLSKYFLVFLVAGLVLYTIALREKKYIKNIVLVLLVIIPFGLQNLYFNYNSCWNNIMFNFFARTEDLKYNISTFLGFIAILVYFITPWGLYYLFKSKIEKNKLRTFLIFSLSVGLLVYALVSLKKPIGLHWLLLFLPLVVMFFAYLKEEYYKKMFTFTLFFTYLHITVLLMLVLLPTSIFESHKKYNSVLLFMKTQQICEKIDKYDNIYTTDYTSASIYSYHCNKDINMIMNNSKYGREFDKLVNIQDLQDQAFNILFEKEPDIKELHELFSNFTIIQIPILNTKFYMASVSGLNYEVYKKYYLDKQKEKIYAIPDWLPKGECYFLDRYYK